MPEVLPQETTVSALSAQAARGATIAASNAQSRRGVSRDTRGSFRSDAGQGPVGGYEKSSAETSPIRCKPESRKS